MKSFLIFIFSLLMVINCYIFLNSRIKAKAIFDNPLQTQQCIHYSTKKFSGGEKMQKEYWVFECSLNSEFKSLIFYYDPNTQQIVKSQFFNMNRKNLSMPVTQWCGYEKIEKDAKTQLYEQCSIFIGKERFLWLFELEVSFDTPLNLVTDKQIIAKELKSSDLQ